MVVCFCLGLRVGLVCIGAAAGAVTGVRTRKDPDTRSSSSGESKKFFLSAYGFSLLEFRTASWLRGLCLLKERSNFSISEKYVITLVECIVKYIKEKRIFI